MVEDLGEGASVVRSRNDGEEKEVWVLRMDGQENSQWTRPFRSEMRTLLNPKSKSRLNL